MVKKNFKIFIAGHNGFLGSALVDQFKENNYKNLILKNRNQLDLLNFNAVEKFFKKYKPDIVINAAGNSGNLYRCIQAPADLYFINSTIQNNLFEAAKKFKIKKTMFLGSSCIYPKNSKNPIQEKYLLSGYLEKTNEAYALSKIGGLKFSEYLIKQYKMDIRCS